MFLQTSVSQLGNNYTSTLARVYRDAIRQIKVIPPAEI